MIQQRSNEGKLETGRADDHHDLIAVGATVHGVPYIPTVVAAVPLPTRFLYTCPVRIRFWHYAALISAIKALFLLP